MGFVVYSDVVVVVVVVSVIDGKLPKLLLFSGIIDSQLWEIAMSTSEAPLVLFRAMLGTSARYFFLFLGASSHEP
jgi:hypothetical protein